MGDPSRHSFQVLKRKCLTHGAEPGTKTGDPRNAPATEMESANRLASKNLDYPLGDQLEGCCTSA